MVLITDFVSGLAGLAGGEAFADTGLATAFLLAAGATGFTGDFFATGRATALAGLAGVAFFRAGLAVALAGAFTGLTAALAATFGTDLAAGLALALDGVFDIVLAGALAGVADFFLAVAFTIGLLWKSAPQSLHGFFLAGLPKSRPACLFARYPVAGSSGMSAFHQLHCA